MSQKVLALLYQNSMWGQKNASKTEKNPVWLFVLVLTLVFASSNGKVGVKWSDQRQHQFCSLKST